jgi:putative hydrolase of the HAD superfamily
VRAAVFEAVLFDLWGTLVPPFPKAEHGAALRRSAELLGLPAEHVRRCWGTLGPRRFRGDFATVADIFAAIARERGMDPGPDALGRAEAAYLDFTRGRLRPLSGTEAALVWMRARGLRLAVVSNCAPDVPQVWEGIGLAAHFAACAWSCRVGVSKPESGLYCHALSALGAAPERTLYVRDGSDRELTGARDCGMHPVLLAVDASGAYDDRREDVESWRGPVLSALSELPAFLTGTT